MMGLKNRPLISISIFISTTKNSIFLMNLNIIDFQKVKNFSQK
ncbi:hypothetical protein RA0C_0238 [Riemerella anatipestifer ATCC 11845 = DSM 15868]|uniref:Uncharacterized protein n=1 Tax=Riemerella anatipestifer (strain ATCC 11845 / DSM 15868 / JCM 9532 / NCTC 11014) TaxID=693978 RepID=H8MC12_RIEAD|nr:hypothetical protein RA0C_0238 [Riemerella anatipestifer ATCC 11845 = DSM 15868]